MKKAGAARRALIVRMVPPSPRPVIDVGADHGHVAAALGAIATERMPVRRGKAPVRWVVADGLRPFREAPVAVIAGMGALTIARILTEGPRPQVAVLHAQDDPPRLRLWLAANGWRIDAEGLAPEARAYAEVIRAVPGREPSTGMALFHGPCLMSSHDPHLRPHLRHRIAHHRGIATATAGRAPSRHEQAMAHVDFLQEVLESLESR